MIASMPSKLSGSPEDSSKHESKAKRKLAAEPEIEIDLKAAEPPSKKTKRKAEKLSKAGLPDRKPLTPAPSDSTSAKQATNGKEHGIWIGNLSFTTTKDDLTDFFTTKSDITASQITRVNLPTSESDRKETHRHRTQNRGFAYVDFDSAATLNKALKLTETLLSGRKVLIKDSSDYTGRPKKSTDETEAVIEASTKAGHPPNRRVFIGNLSFETTQQDVRAHLGQCGEIVKIDLCTFEDSGKCKGFGFIDFKELDSAISAVRGWVEVAAEEEDEDAPGTDDGISRRPRRKSVKILNGRPIRFQFAEDSYTRYKKRYKGGIKENDRVVLINDLPSDAVRPVSRNAAVAGDTSVAHRTGQIMESRAQKTTFA